MWVMWPRRPSSACIVASVVSQLPGMPKLFAMDMNRMRQSQFLGRLGHAGNDSSRVT